jgi:hypothetical protein
MEDYIYTSGSGDLDQRNGRFCITPEYPGGTYAYFATIDAPLSPTFPYTFYKTYYGTVQAGNTGPGSGHNTITESVVIYTSSSELEQKIEVNVFPNPTSDYLNLYILPGSQCNLQASLINPLGQEVDSKKNIQPAVQYAFDLTDLPGGIYYLRLTANGITSVKKIVVSK